MCKRPKSSFTCKGQPSEAAHGKGLAPTPPLEVDNLLPVEVHLVRAHRMSEESVAFVIPTLVKRIPDQLIKISRSHRAREVLELRTHCGRSRRRPHDGGRKAECACKCRSSIHMGLEHGGSTRAPQHRCGINAIPRERHARRQLRGHHGGMRWRLERRKGRHERRERTGQVKHSGEGFCRVGAAASSHARTHARCKK